MYLDPGFGSMIIQGAIALIAGCGAYLILMRKRIVAFLRGRRARKCLADENTIEKQG